MREKNTREMLTRTFMLAMLCFAITSTLPATATVLPECDQTWFEVDTLAVTTDAAELLKTKKEEAEIDWIVVIYANAGGDSALLIDPFSITFTGDCGGLDTTETTEVFDFIASESIRLAVEANAISTSTNPSNPATIDVWIPTCVMITGAGATTTYTSIQECDQAARHYTYSSPSSGFQAGYSSVSGDVTCSSGTPTVDPGMLIE